MNCAEISARTSEKGKKKWYGAECGSITMNVFKDDCSVDKMEEDMLAI